MRIGQFRKAAADRKRYVVEYTDWMEEAENITAVIVTGTNMDDAFIVDGFVISTDLKDIIFFVSGGIVGTSYDVFINITTSLGQIKEDWVTFKVI